MATLINDPVTGQIVKDILAEVKRSKDLHPAYPKDDLRRTAITMEEIIETVHEWTKLLMLLQKSALHVARVGNEDVYNPLADLRKELVQAGAMVFRQLERMEVEGWMNDKERV